MLYATAGQRILALFFRRGAGRGLNRSAGMLGPELIEARNTATA
jgi:hypothetical protein